MTDKDDIAALKKKVEELEAKVSPPQSTFVPETDAEHCDRVHRMREGRMNYAMPPSVIRDMAVLDDRLVKEITLRDARAPNTPSAIPSSQQPTGPRPSAGDGSGWAREIPLGPSPHQRYVDQQIDAQEAKDRQERIQQAAQAETARKFAERSEQLDRATEQTRKLVGSKP